MKLLRKPAPLSRMIAFIKNLFHWSPHSSPQLIEASFLDRLDLTVAHGERAIPPSWLKSGFFAFLLSKDSGLPNRKEKLPLLIFQHCSTLRCVRLTNTLFLKKVPHWSPLVGSQLFRSSSDVTFGP
jgi:hypothetical protein